MALYRILSLDGGNGLNTAILLDDVQTDLLAAGQSGVFLDQVDLFCGASAGGINSLFFAFQEDPNQALADIKTFWQDIYSQINPCANWHPGGILGAFAGFTSILSTTKLREFFISYFGSQTTLGDLKKKVLILSFELDNGNAFARSWKPKLFHNLPADSPDLAELVVDVALRTSAFPIEFPIYQSLAGTGSGYVDGGLVANQPAMCAVAQALRLAQNKQDDLRLLSIGTGRNVIGTTEYLAPTYTDGEANWGYGQWLFSAQEPLVLLDLVLQATMEIVTFQCRSVLGDHYFRLEPTLKRGLVQGDKRTAVEVAATAAWLVASGWVPPIPPAAVTRPATGKKTAAER
jgi:patatin-like phospholipase/acyl hydrolase